MKAVNCPAAIAAVLMAVILSCAVPARAAVPPPLNIDDVVGTYAVSDSWVTYDFTSPVSSGKSKDSFVISKTGDTQLHLVWNAGGSAWNYDGYYYNGVFIVGMGTTGDAPTPYMESMYVLFSGTPGKVKMRGKYFYYEQAVGTTDVETYSGKRVP